MKRRIIIRFIIICIFFAGNANGQQTAGNVPIVFSQTISFKQFPEHTSCDRASLDDLFSMHDEISLKLSNDFLIKGKIISHVKPNASAETINVSLPDFHGSVFTISRVRTEEGKIKFVGHILNLENNDAIILKEENQKYFFIKTEQRLLVTD